MFISRTIATRTLAVAAISVVALSGCSSSDKGETPATATTVKTSTAAATTTVTTQGGGEAVKLTSENFHFHDAFVKAAPEGKKMTAVFGVLENHTDKPVHLVGFSSSVKAKQYQIHEVVNGTMQEKTGGIVVGANAKHELAPGGDHLMLMGLEKPVEAGSKVSVTLKFDDGSSLEIKDIPVRALGAGNESYGDMNMDHKDGDMNMDHKHGDMNMDHKDGDMKMGAKDSEKK